jgi:small-conductance mechanosensitive channel
VVRRVAHRAISNPSTFWRVRVPRLFGETAELAEKRRRQRIDATSRMLGHLFALVAWIVSMVVILHVLEVNLIPVLTSAGFIGAGLAIGGQHAVKDFISGIGILTTMATALLLPVLRDSLGEQLPNSRLDWLKKEA